MNNIKEYLHSIAEEQIPDRAPKMNNGLLDLSVEAYQGRSFCNQLGLWTLIDRQWTGSLASWIGNVSVLEVMAGAGWLAKGLAETGANIIATDDFSWANGQQHAQSMNLVYPVKKMEATKAVKKIKADILLVSWPPYQGKAICRVCELWGSKKPIIYIGEGPGGCTACDEFYDHFEYDIFPVDFPQWPGIHDCIMIGYYR